MLTLGLLSLWRAKASENWPTVDGVIVFSERDTTGRAVPLAYEYEVNGEKHFSNVRHFGQIVSSSGNWADEILKRFPTGTRVPVTHSPTDPDVAALESGINPEAWYLPGGGAALLLFGLAALYMFLRH